MTEKKFDPAKLKKLNNPDRLLDIPPQDIEKRLGLKNQPRIMVDLGAGTAFFSIAFLDQFAPETIYACDLSPTMTQWIRENVTPHHPGIRAILNQESSVPLEDSLADLVFMICLHHELEDPVRVMGEAFRLLKPGGLVLIIDWLKKQMDQGPPMEIRCRPEEVKAQLGQAGFDDICIHPPLAKHFMVTGKKDQ